MATKKTNGSVDGADITAASEKITDTDRSTVREAMLEKQILDERCARLEAELVLSRQARDKLTGELQSIGQRLNAAYSLVNGRDSVDLRTGVITRPTAETEKH